jgi:RNA polymerase sigma-70 factor (ECF subfamily)
MQAMMNLASAKHRSKFDRLMKENYRKAYAFAYRMSGSREEAEDITQEAFVKAYRAFDRYDTSRPFERWLFRIIANLFVDRLRSRPKRAVLSLDTPVEGVDGDSLYSDIPDERSDPARIVVESVMDERILAALNSLPEPFRETVVLTDIEGVGYEEAAEMLGCAVGTIRSRLHRARVMMRNQLLRSPALSA